MRLRSGCKSLVRISRLLLAVIAGTSFFSPRADAQHMDGDGDIDLVCSAKSKSGRYWFENLPEDL